MGKARMMGAGNAGSSLYNSNVNLKTGGGNKKQGLPFSLDGIVSFNHKHVVINAVGNKRDIVYTMNQLGGVSSSSFGSSRNSYENGDGIHYDHPFVHDPYIQENTQNIKSTQFQINLDTIITSPRRGSVPPASCSYTTYGCCPDGKTVSNQNASNC